MATQTGQSASGTGNKWIKPLIPLAIIVVVSVVLLYVGGLINVMTSGEGSAALPLSSWLFSIVAGAVVIYGLYVGFADRPIWQVGTREVVYMAIGAALYGVLSWLTNFIQLPSISLVSLRPAAVIPVFFGIAFGPVVGFFSGFVGNVLGDALTGWGVYPLWDVGNGLMGMVPGLMLGFRNRERALNTLTYVVAGVAGLAAVLMLLNWNYTVSDFAGNEFAVGPLVWIPILAGVLVVGARYLFAKNIDTAAAVVWGALGVIVGMGFAAFGGIIQNGTSPGAAFFGEFVPAAGSNLLAVAILLPILLSAWTSAQARSGR
jgi:uncharacterized membrane protein